MNKKQLGIYLLIGLIFFITYNLKPSFVGLDSYFYLNVVFGKMANTETGLANIIFSIIPANIFIIKTIIVSFFTLDLIIIGLIGEKIFKKRGWIIGLFTLFNIPFMLQAFKFEDEIFIFPVIFLTFLIFFNSSLKKTLIAFIFALFFVNLIWVNGANSIPLFAELEYFPMANIFGLFVVLSLGLSGYFISDKLKKIMPIIVSLCIISLIVPKIDFIIAPFLAIGCFAVFERFFERMGDIENLEKKIVYMAIAISLLSLVYLNFTIPNENFINAAEQSVNLSKNTGLPVKNNWSFGYLVYWFGGETGNYAGGELLQDYNESIALTRKRLFACKLKTNYNNEAFVHVCR